LRDRSDLGMLPAVPRLDLREHELNARYFAPYKPVMLAGDVRDEVAERLVVPLDRRGLGARCAVEEIEYKLDANARTRASVGKRALATAAVVDAERLEEPDARRVLNRNLLNRLFDCRFHCLPLIEAYGRLGGKAVT